MNKLIAAVLIVVLGVAFLNYALSSDMDDTYAPIPPGDDNGGTTTTTPTHTYTRTTTTAPPTRVTGYVGLRLKAYGRDGVAWPITLKKNALNILIKYPTGRWIDVTKMEIYPVFKVSSAPQAVIFRVKSMSVDLLVNGRSYNLGGRSTTASAAVSPGKYWEMWGAKVTVTQAQIEPVIRNAGATSGYLVVKALIEAECGSYHKTFQYEAKIEVRLSSSGDLPQPLSVVEATITPLS